jgi:transposase
MEVRLVSTPSAALDSEAAMSVFAIELSRANWSIGVQKPSGGKIGRHQLEAGDAQGLLELIDRICAREARKLGRPVAAVSCYEAGYDGFWLHRVLEAHGVRNYVLDAASLQVNRRARRAKTDRIDAERMVRALLAHLRGDPEACSVVRVPSVIEEDAKRLDRERDRLITERVQHVNRIKGLCALQGIYDYEPLRRKARARLEQLRTGDGRPLPERLRAELIRELERLELVLKMVAAVEAERNAIVAGEADAPAHPCAEKAQALAKLKGIGPGFAIGLSSEVFYRNFANRREVAGYVGLTPAPFRSGAVDRDQGITKAGNAKARSLMIELAWMWLRHQPDSTLSAWFRERVGDLKGRPRRIAIVAVARKLLVALWRYLEVGLIPSGAVLKG